MNNIIELIKKRNNNYKLLDMLDIEYIINELADIFDIKIMGIKNEKNKYMMSLYLNNLEIVVDYEKIRINKNIIYANYLTLFAIVHELRHYCQLKQDSGSISYIYQKCFNYINSPSLLKNAFYSLFHEYFPVEINADIVGFLYVLYIQKRIGDQNYYLVFKNMLFNLLEKQQNKEMYQVLISILGDKYLEILKDLTEYELFINGLMSDKEKRDEMVKKILL